MAPGLLERGASPLSLPRAPLGIMRSRFGAIPSREVLSVMAWEKLVSGRVPDGVATRCECKIPWSLALVLHPGCPDDEVEAFRRTRIFDM